jgi:hypothetical protein
MMLANASISPKKDKDPGRVIFYPSSMYVQRAENFHILDVQKMKFPAVIRIYSFHFWTSRFRIVDHDAENYFR